MDSHPDEDLYLGFGAGLHDRHTGLIHFGYREYDPSVGRFISPDPIGYEGGDVDVYGFCLDDPVNFVDRNGLAGKSAERKLGKSNEEKNKDNFINKAGNYLYKVSGLSRAEKIGLEELAKRNRGSHNNQKDAMRHAEWSRRMTEELGATRAWGIGTAYEIRGMLKDGQPLNEAMMDLHNNAEGRSAAREGRRVDRSKLQNKPRKGFQLNTYDPEEY